MPARLTSLKPITYSVLVAFALSVMPIVPVSAATIGNQQMVEQQTLQDARTTVDAFMARDDVRQQFQKLGVDPNEAEQRVAALSDSEIQNIAGKIQNAPAGQGAIGAIVGAAVLIFIVLLITDILGLTNVFNFTKPVR
jgi:cell pole-organizing protein PopZ